jgi:hypothetical protein
MSRNDDASGAQYKRALQFSQLKVLLQCKLPSERLLDVALPVIHMLLAPLHQPLALKRGCCIIVQ